MEMEMAAGECQNNGAPEAEEVSENILLDSGKLGALKRREFVDNLLKHVEDDNLHFLQRQKERIDRQVLFAVSGRANLVLVMFFFLIVIHIHRVGVKLPTVEVVFQNLCVEAESRYSGGGGSHLPTLWNSIKDFLSVMNLVLRFAKLLVEMFISLGRTSVWNNI